MNDHTLTHTHPPTLWLTCLHNEATDAKVILYVPVGLCLPAGLSPARSRPHRPVSQDS